MLCDSRKKKTEKRYYHVNACNAIIIHSLPPVPECKCSIFVFVSCGSQSVVYNHICMQQTTQYDHEMDWFTLGCKLIDENNGQHSLTQTGMHYSTKISCFKTNLHVFHPIHRHATVSWRPIPPQSWQNKHTHTMFGIYYIFFKHSSILLHSTQSSNTTHTHNKPYTANVIRQKLQLSHTRLEYILCICMNTENIYTYQKCNSSLAPFQHSHTTTLQKYTNIRNPREQYCMQFMTIVYDRT